MKKFIFYIGLGTAYILSLIPIPILRFLGNMLGIIGYKFAIKRRKVGLINLTLCFPEMSESNKEDIIKQHFKDLMTAALEYGLVFYGSKRRIKNLVKIVNFEYIQQYYLKRPIILLYPHFIGLELGGVRLTMELDLCSMYSRQKSAAVTNYLKKSRSRFATDAKVFHSRQEGLRNIIKYMKQTKTPFLYLPDQDLGVKDSIYVPFFAQESCATITTLAKLAKLTNAVVIPVATYRVNNHYEVTFSEAWSDYPSDNERENVLKMNHFIENAVLEHIEQYFWLHKRFKTQPDGRHKLYTNSEHY